MRADGSAPEFEVLIRRVPRAGAAGVRGTVVPVAAASVAVSSGAVESGDGRGLSPLSHPQEPRNYAAERARCRSQRSLTVTAASSTRSSHGSGSVASGPSRVVTGTTLVARRGRLRCSLSTCSPRTLVGCCEWGPVVDPRLSTGCPTEPKLRGRAGQMTPGNLDELVGTEHKCAGRICRAR